MLENAREDYGEGIGGGKTSEGTGREDIDEIVRLSIEDMGVTGETVWW